MNLSPTYDKMTPHIWRFNKEPRTYIKVNQKKDVDDEIQDSEFLFGKVYQLVNQSLKIKTNGIDRG